MHKLLRAWYRHARDFGRETTNPVGKHLALGPINPLSPRQLNRAFHTGLEHAQIDKRVTPEFIRRFLIHLLPSGFHRIRRWDTRKSP